VNLQNVTHRTAALLFMLVSCSLAFAQPVPQARAFLSPEVTTDKKIVFRVYAPNAQNVRVFGTDLPGLRQNGQMAKNEKGIWELVFGPVDPGAYRYNLIIDGAD
jgi:enterochelin esterase family protein